MIEGMGVQLDGSLDPSTYGVSAGELAARAEADARRALVGSEGVVPLAAALGLYVDVKPFDAANPTCKTTYSTQSESSD